MSKTLNIPKGVLNKIAIEQARIIPGHDPETTDLSNFSTLELKKIVLTAVGLANLGFYVDPDSISMETYEFVKDNYGVFQELVGAHRSHTHLFPDFPETNPESMDNALTHSLLSVFDTDLYAGRLKEYDSSVPLSESHKAKIEALQSQLSGDSHVVWKDLSTSRNLTQDLIDWATKTAASTKSLRADQLTAVYWFADIIDFNSVVFGETRGILLTKLWEVSPSNALEKTQSFDDILRLMAGITGTDVSLAETIRFPKLKRSQRRAILGRLESLSSQANANTDSLVLRRGLWLALAKSLHVGEYKAQYPKTFELFDRLRNNSQTLRTQESRLQKAIDDQNLELVLLELQKTPSVFARKIRNLLHKFSDDTEQVIEAFSGCAHNVPVANLLVLKKRNLNRDNHVLITNKFGKSEIQPVNLKLSQSVVQKLDRSIDTAIKTKLQKSLTHHDRINIDTEILDCVLPLQQRKSSVSLLNLAQGSKMAVTETDKVLRLFVYWVGQDLDLSLIMLDENLDLVNQVSYTNLAALGACHSGDITWAPDGASEFIDIPIANLPNKVRYLVPQIHNYSGPNFSDIEAFSGWMYREEVSSDTKTFDAKTVANKFELNGKARTMLPFIFDVQEQAMTIVDTPLYSRGYGQSVESTFAKAAQIIGEALKLHETRPTYRDLASAYLRAFPEANIVSDDDVLETDLEINLSSDLSSFLK